MNIRISPARVEVARERCHGRDRRGEPQPSPQEIAGTAALETRENLERVAEGRDPPAGLKRRYAPDEELPGYVCVLGTLRCIREPRRRWAEENGVANEVILRVVYDDPIGEAGAR